MTILSNAISKAVTCTHPAARTRPTHWWNYELHNEEVAHSDLGGFIMKQLHSCHYEAHSRLIVATMRVL